MPVSKSENLMLGFYVVPLPSILQHPYVFQHPVRTHYAAQASNVYDHVAVMLIAVVFAAIIRE